MLAFALALLATAAAQTAFPGGRVLVPTGCDGPTRIKMATDSFIGTIECRREGLSIFIIGDGRVSQGCGSTGVEMVDLRLNNGHPIHVCAVEYPAVDSSKVLLRKLILDVGAAQIVAEVRSPRDAFLLVQVASSFEADR